MNQATAPIIVEELFHASIMDVWNAITRRDQMTQWFFGNILAFEARKGFKTEFSVQSGGRTFTHVWKILEAVPGRRIKYHWTYAEYPGEGTVTFELRKNKFGTMLRLSNEGIETFPQNIPEFTRESCQAGWDYFIRGRLKEYLEGKDDSEPRSAR